jgi:hypothetical protein
MNNNLVDVNKRVSKRIYPSRKCRKPGCGEDFIPNDKRQATVVHNIELTITMMLEMKKIWK